MIKEIKNAISNIAANIKLSPKVKKLFESKLPQSNNTSADKKPPLNCEIPSAVKPPQENISVADRKIYVEITFHAKTNVEKRIADLELSRKMIQKFPADWRLSQSGNIDIIFLSKNNLPLLINGVQSIIKTITETGTDFTQVSFVTSHEFGSIHKKSNSVIKAGFMSRNSFLAYIEVMITRYSREKWFEKVNKWSEVSHIYSPNVVITDEETVYVRQGEWKKKKLDDEITYTPLYPVEIISGKVKIGSKIGYLEYGPRCVRIIRGEIDRSIRGKSYWALENFAKCD